MGIFSDNSLERAQEQQQKQLEEQQAEEQKRKDELEKQRINALRMRMGGAILGDSGSATSTKLGS